MKAVPGLTEVAILMNMFFNLDSAVRIISLTSAAAAISVGFTGCQTTPRCRPALPPPVVRPKAGPVIDVHSHMFNAHYVPVQQILEARGELGETGIANPEFAWLVAKGINLWTGDSFRGRCIFSRTSDNRVPASARLALGAPQADYPKSVFTPRERSKLVEFLRVPGMRPSTTNNMFLEGIPSDGRMLMIALERARFLAEEQPKPDEDFGAFVNTLTSAELNIFEQAKRENEADGQEVGLFIQHMMDVENTYDGKAQITWKNQLSCYRQLDEASSGRVLHFVAFDPFSRKAALDRVKRGTKEGAIGIKLYPPSGYRATSNAVPPEPKSGEALRQQWKHRYSKLPGAALDAILDQLFRYCTNLDIPLLAHCSPQGFEAGTNYGESVSAMPVAKTGGFLQPVFRTGLLMVQMLSSFARLIRMLTVTRRSLIQFFCPEVRTRSLLG